MTEQTVVFGIGAQKSGSSWLHEYLSSHPSCHLRTQKELHYFDALEGMSRSYFKTLRNRAKNMAERRKAFKFYELKNRRQLAQKVHDIESWINVFDGETQNDQAYLDYLKSGSKNASVIGEVTPEYSIVNEDSLRHMVSIAPRTKFIYILRDPLDRTWSHIRMTANRKKNKELSYKDRANQEMDKFLAGETPDVDIRSDYAGSLERLKNVVPPEDLLIEYFEDMFSGDTARRVTDFLNIPHHPAKTKEVAFKGKSLKLDDDRKRAAISVLKPQYEACAKLLDGKLPDRWQTHYDMLSEPAAAGDFDGKDG